MTKLQQSLGFQCEPLTRYSAKDNSTGFTHFINELQDCTNTSTGTVIPRPTCQYDIGIAGFRENVQRVGRVDFVSPFLHDGLAVVTHVNDTHVKTNGAFFLAAFEPAVWIFIVALTISFTFLKLLDKRFLEDTPPPPNALTPPGNQSIWKRVRCFMLKQEHLRRLRKALQDVCKLFCIIRLPLCV